MGGLPIFMSDQAWDGIFALPEQGRDEVIRLLDTLMRDGDASFPKDHWGRGEVVLPGDVFITFERRETPEPHFWLYPPIPWVEPGR